MRDYHFIIMNYEIMKIISFDHDKSLMFASGIDLYQSVDKQVTPNTNLLMHSLVIFQVRVDSILIGKIMSRAKGTR